MTAVLEGIGAWLPPTIVTNDDLCRTLDVRGQWIEDRTGILERRVVSRGMATVDLAVQAGARALKSARRTSVDTVLVATTSPDRIGLAAAPEVAHRLGLGTVAAFDLNSACSGFVYGLATAVGLIDSTVATSVLLICAEAFSTFVNPLDRHTAPIFGDGAGAVVLRQGRPDEPGAFGAFDLGSDGARADLFAVPGGGSRDRSANGPGRAAPTETWYVNMAGRPLFQQAVTRMTGSARAVLAKVGWSVADIDCFIGHQANIRILRAVAEELELPAERVATNICHVGNTLAASIPILLNDMAARGGHKPGGRMLLAAFGSGLSWGSTVLTWANLRAEDVRQ